MDGPGPATQANRAARAQRATRRASGEKPARSAQESQSAQETHGGRQADDRSGEEHDSSEEEEGEDEDEEEGGEEKPPVHHHEIWKKLLRKGSQGGRLSYFNGQPKSGSHPLDTTAVESTQVNWDIEDREFWPEQLKLWERPTPWQNPTNEIGVMKYKGRIVVDYAGNPIRDFPIPLTISSQVEGLRIEAWMRADNRLTLGDIEAREWTKDATRGRKVPAFDKRALSKRASNSRIKAGLISWMIKKGREAHTAFLDRLRTPAQRARNLATNIDLTHEQYAQFQMIGLRDDNTSQAPTRAERIKKIKRVAGIGGTVAGPSSGTATAGPSDAAAAASGDDDNLTDDTEGDVAVQESPARDQSSEDDTDDEAQDQPSEDDTDDEGSVSSRIRDPLDSRNDQPTNPQEVALLREALEDTVQDFISQTGQAPQLKEPGDNYFSQWAELQQQFTNLWALSGSRVEAPRLRARGRWTGGLARYHRAEVNEGSPAGYESE